MRYTVFFRDGSNKIFDEKYTMGGHWPVYVKYEGNFVTIDDSDGKRVAFPMDLVLRVEKERIR